MKRAYVCILSTILFWILVSCDKPEQSIEPFLSFVQGNNMTVSWIEQNIDVKVNTNVEFSVSTDCNWITINQSVSEQGSYLDVLIQENPDSLSSRVGKIILNSQKEPISATLSITQSQKNIVRLSSRTLQVSDQNQNIEIVANSNCDYDIIIPDSVKEWIGLRGTTKAIAPSQFVLSISKNTTNYIRKASIILSDLTQGAQDTLRIIQDEGFLSLRKILRDNNNVTLFYNALQVTHLMDSISKYIDESYPGVSYDSTLECFRKTPDLCSVIYSTAYETDEHAVFPDKRLFKYTVFVVPDSILKPFLISQGLLAESDVNNNAVCLDALRSYAESVYPEGSGTDDDRCNSLNKLLSYHILPVGLSYDQFNVSEQGILDNRVFYDELDVEDFYETMQPHSLMRISSAYDLASKPKVKNNRLGIFINRKGTVQGLQNGKQLIQGIMINDLTDRADISSIAQNGYYYYIDDLLLYDEYTRDVLNARIRIMTSTLSPDFINSGARGRMMKSEGDENDYTSGFIPNYCKNVSWTPGTEFYLRYRNATFGHLYGEDMTIRGDYDISFKLPPVPNDGMYEIRSFNNSLGTSSKNDRGTAQFFLREGDKGEWTFSTEPINLRLEGSNPIIGWQMYSSRTDSLAIDIAMRNNGYMKAPDIYKNIADSENCYRVILFEQYLKANQDYYLRIKKVDIDNTVTTFSFIELVPESIYTGREDRH